MSKQTDFDVELHRDVTRRRTDATRMCVDVLRAIGHTLHTGRSSHVRLNVPADPVTASVLGASVLRLAGILEREGLRSQ